MSSRGPGFRIGVIGRLLLSRDEHRLGRRLFRHYLIQVLKPEADQPVGEHRHRHAVVLTESVEPRTVLADVRAIHGGAWHGGEASDRHLAERADVLLQGLVIAFEDAVGTLLFLHESLNVRELGPGLAQ